MLSEHDDGLMQKYLDGVEVPSAELRSAVRRATLALEVVPVLYGASFRNKGVQPLLDAVVDFLPSPADVLPVTGLHPRTQAPETRAASDEAPFSGLVFKIANDPFLGSLAYFRVYSGKAKIGQAVYNSAKGEEEKLSASSRCTPTRGKRSKRSAPGTWGPGMGSMKNISTGDTLCLKSHPIVLESIRFPEPVIAATIEPKTKADHVKLATTLAKLVREDTRPSRSARTP